MGVQKDAFSTVWLKLKKFVQLESKPFSLWKKTVQVLYNVLLIKHGKMFVLKVWFGVHLKKNVFILLINPFVMLVKIIEYVTLVVQLSLVIIDVLMENFYV